MTTNEQKVLSIIWNWGGEASVDTISREAGISMDYVRNLCEHLGREDYIDFLHLKLCKIKKKGKSAVTRNRSQSPPKIVISGQGSRNKKERSILNY